MGTFSRSWDLLTQSFALLKSDKQLVWLPIVSGFSCLIATIIIFSFGALVLIPVTGIPHGAAGQKFLTQSFTPVIFLYYLVTYCIVIFSTSRSSVSRPIALPAAMPRLTTVSRPHGIGSGAFFSGRCSAPPLA